MASNPFPALKNPSIFLPMVEGWPASQTLDKVRAKAKAGRLITKHGRLCDLQMPKY